MLAQVGVQVNIWLNNCKQIIMSPSLLVGTTVAYKICTYLLRKQNDIVCNFSRIWC